MTINKKDGKNYIRKWEGFKEEMPMFNNKGANITVSKDGKILDGEMELSVQEYIHDADIELSYELLKDMSHDLGPFHEKTRALRKELDNKINEYRFNNPNGIPARVFFQNIKANLKEININDFQEKLNNCKKLIEYYKHTNQEGAQNKAQKLLISLLKEKNIQKNNINFSVNRAEVNKFVRYVKYENRTVAFLKHIRDFPRIIPSEVLSILEDCKEKELFDHYEILYLDYSKDQEETETDQTKLEKDPILFGVLKENPEKLYFITYWEDELCHLNMEELLDKILQNPDNEAYSFINHGKDVDFTYINQTISDLMRHEKDNPDRFQNNKKDFFQVIKDKINIKNIKKTIIKRLKYKKLLD